MDTTLPARHAHLLGQRIERYRLLQNISQVDLARHAGIGERTLRRLESGKGGTVDTLVRVLTALKLEANLDALVPDHTVRPIERIRQAKTERQRASKQRTAKNKTVRHKDSPNPEAGANWTWGDKKP